MTYTFDGKQHIAVASGPNTLSFALMKQAPIGLAQAAVDYRDLKRRGVDPRPRFINTFVPLV